MVSNIHICLKFVGVFKASVMELLLVDADASNGVFCGLLIC